MKQFFEQAKPEDPFDCKVTVGDGLISNKLA